MKRKATDELVDEEEEEKKEKDYEGDSDKDKEDEDEDSEEEEVLERGSSSSVDEEEEMMGSGDERKIPFSSTIESELVSDERSLGDKSGDTSDYVKEDRSNTISSDEDTATVDDDVLQSSTFDQLMPDEVLARVFYLADFPSALARVSKRWNRVYAMNFCYTKTTLQWADVGDEYAPVRYKIMNGLATLMRDYGRNPRTLFSHASAAYSAFLIAVFEGKPWLVKKFMDEDPRVDPTAGDTLADKGENISIQIAASDGYAEIVRLLLRCPRVDPTVHGNIVLKIATMKHRTDVLKVLLSDPRIDPSIENSMLLRTALIKGHCDIVKLLLQDPRIDPTEETSYALRTAFDMGSQEMIRVLLDDPRINPPYHQEDSQQLSEDTPTTETTTTTTATTGLVNQPSTLKKILNYGLSIAAYKGNADVVKLLLEDPRISYSWANSLVVYI